MGTGAGARESGPRRCRGRERGGGFRPEPGHQPELHTSGRRYFLPNRIAPQAAVSEQNWADILKVAKDAAAGVGATSVQVIHDEPGNHDVWISGPAGIFIKVSYQGNLVVAGYTGCRLPGPGQ
jgi:Lipoprotein confined to pathogenic Mycobacterium